MMSMVVSDFVLPFSTKRFCLDKGLKNVFLRMYLITSTTYGQLIIPVINFIHYKGKRSELSRIDFQKMDD